MSEPRYLQRDPNTGEVLGHFSHPHDYAKEEVPEDHPAILAWQAKRAAVRAAYMERKATLDPEKLLARLEALEARLKANG